MSKEKDTVIMSFRAEREMADTIEFYCEHLGLDKTSLLKMLTKYGLRRLEAQGGEIFFESIPSHVQTPTTYNESAKRVDEESTPYNIQEIRSSKAKNLIKSHLANLPETAEPPAALRKSPAANPKSKDIPITRETEIKKLGL